MKSDNGVCFGRTDGASSLPLSPQTQREPTRTAGSTPTHTTLPVLFLFKPTPRQAKNGAAMPSAPATASRVSGSSYAAEAAPTE